jgi:hypothetical protein
MSDEAARVCQVLQEGGVDLEADPLGYCPCGGEVRRGFDFLIADHIRLSWFCESCGRFWRTACAVIIGGTMRALSPQESQDCL